jgi:hypothetical protein
MVVALLLFQAVVQVPPNTVYIHEAPSIPEWVRILISAGTGAVFAIIGNVAMEFIRPRIVRGSSKREVKKQLISEVKENVRLLGEVRKIWNADPPPANRVPHAMATLNRIRDERYRFYLAKETIFVYEIDRPKNLEKLYRLSKRDIPGAISNGGMSIHPDEPGTASELIEYAHFVGDKFVEWQTELSYKRFGRWVQDNLRRS